MVGLLILKSAGRYLVGKTFAAKEFWNFIVDVIIPKAQYKVTKKRSINVLRCH
jgi:hypothetical protein